MTIKTWSPAQLSFRARLRLEDAERVLSHAFLSLERRHARSFPHDFPAPADLRVGLRSLVQKLRSPREEAHTGFAEDLALFEVLRLAEPWAQAFDGPQVLEELRALRALLLPTALPSLAKGYDRFAVFLDRILLNHGL